MRKVWILLFIFLFLKVEPIRANPITSSSDVSASVPSSNFYAPDLISPPNNHASNSARFTFVWERPSPLPTTTLDHYDLFIDNAVFAASVPDSLASQDFYFYTATRSNDLFYVSLKQDLAQGYHTWRVAVYDNTGQNTATGDWTFYIDSIAPFISLLKINTTTYSWNTSVSGSIPDESSRYLNVYSSNPTLSGEVETNANLLVSLTCVSTAPASCTNQSWTINSTDGKWEKQFSNLIANIYYIVGLSATDATNNTTIFPPFYIKYTLAGTTVTATTAPTSTLTPSLTPLPTLTPSQTPLPSLTATLTPPPDLSALITPTPFIAKTPPAPTLPPQKKEPLRGSGGYGMFILFFFLCFGLPTHLLVTSFAVSTKWSNCLKFIFTLGFPFLKRKNTFTKPFTFVEVYDPNKLNRHIYQTVSDILGNVYFPKGFPPRVLIKLTNTNLVWKDQIVPSLLLQDACLLPLPKRLLGTKENLQNYMYSLRSIPLVVAILTSSVGLYFYPSIYLVSYLYLSLQYAFSEYAYPKINKK